MMIFGSPLPPVADCLRDAGDEGTYLSRSCDTIVVRLIQSPGGHSKFLDGRLWGFVLMLFSGKLCIICRVMLALLTYFFHNLVSVFGMSVEILALNGVHVRELRFTSKQIDHQSLVVFDAFAGNLYSVYIQLKNSIWVRLQISG